jgi:hypothetical protein
MYGPSLCLSLSLSLPLSTTVNIEATDKRLEETLSSIRRGGRGWWECQIVVEEGCHVSRLLSTPELLSVTRSLPLCLSLYPSATAPNET